MHSLTARSPSLSEQEPQTNWPGRPLASCDCATAAWQRTRASAATLVAQAVLFQESLDGTSSRVNKGSRLGVVTKLWSCGLLW